MKTPWRTFPFDAQGTLSEIGDGLSKKELAKIGWLPLSLTPPPWLFAASAALVGCNHHSTTKGLLRLSIFYFGQE
jgi:hypothetical protein